MPTRLRCVVVGDDGSGKTSLLWRLQFGAKPPDAGKDEYLEAILDQYWLAVQSDGEDFELDMVDIHCKVHRADEDQMNNSVQCARLRPLSLTGSWGGDRGQPAWEGRNGKALYHGKGLPRAVALVCFADSGGLANAEKIYVPEIKLHLDRCPWVLLRLRDDADVATDELDVAAQAVARQHGAVASCRCSAFTGRDCREAVDAAVRAWAIAAVGNRRGRKKCVIM